MSFHATVKKLVAAWRIDSFAKKYSFFIMFSREPLILFP